MTLKTLAPGKTFEQDEHQAGQFRTTSLDSFFDEEDGRNAEEVLGVEYRLSGSSADEDPASRALIKDLISQILDQLPEGIHRTCFMLKYVHGYKREDLIECLKMEPKSIDTIDKKIVRTLKAFKDKMDIEESRV